MGSTEMKQYKYQMSQANYYTPKHNLRVPGIYNDYINEPTLIKNRTHGQLQRFLLNLFNIFSSEENNKPAGSGDENIIVTQNPDDNNGATKSLADLENCANVARGIGACGQYKGTNKTDES